MTRMSFLIAFLVLVASGCATTRLTVTRAHGQPVVTVEFDAEEVGVWSRR